MADGVGDEGRQGSLGYDEEEEEEEEGERHPQGREGSKAGISLIARIAEVRLQSLLQWRGVGGRILARGEGVEVEGERHRCSAQIVAVNFNGRRARTCAHLSIRA